MLHFLIRWDCMYMHVPEREKQRHQWYQRRLRQGEVTFVQNRGSVRQSVRLVQQVVQAGAGFQYRLSQRAQPGHF
jgi:hypothetical protein